MPARASLPRDCVLPIDVLVGTDTVMNVAGHLVRETSRMGCVIQTSCRELDNVEVAVIITRWWQFARDHRLTDQSPGVPPLGASPRNRCWRKMVREVLRKTRMKCW